MAARVITGPALFPSGCSGLFLIPPQPGLDDVERGINVTV
jgi:hypothetical protein